jgi:hypothetical protein
MPRSRSPARGLRIGHRRLLTVGESKASFRWLFAGHPRARSIRHVALSRSWRAVQLAQVADAGSTMLLVGRTATSLSGPGVHGLSAWRAARSGMALASASAAGGAVPPAVRAYFLGLEGSPAVGADGQFGGRALLTARQRQWTSTSAVANQTHPRSERSSRGRRASGAEPDHPKRCRFTRRRTGRRAVVDGRRFGAGEHHTRFGTPFDEGSRRRALPRGPRAGGPACRLTTVCMFHVKRGLRAGHGGAQGRDHECRLESSAYGGPGRSADFPDPRELRQPRVPMRAIRHGGRGRACQSAQPRQRTAACGAVADLREGLTSMRATTAGRDSKSATGIEAPHPSNRPPRGADVWSAGLVRGGLETGHAVRASGGLVHL